MKIVRTLTVRTAIIAVQLSVVLFILTGAVIGRSMAAAQQIDESTIYDIHRHYYAGEVERQKAVATVTTNGPETNGRDKSVKYTFVVRKTVKSMTPDGAMTLVLEYEQAQAEVEGKVLDVTPKMQRLTQVLDAQGNLKTTIEGGRDTEAMAMVKIMATVEGAEDAGMPTMPVKIGATWKMTQPDPLPVGTIWSGVAGLISHETINGYAVAEINYKTDSSADGGAPSKTHTDASLYVDPVTGKTIQLYFRTTAFTGELKTTIDITNTCLDAPPIAAASLKREFKIGDVDRFMLYGVSTATDPQGGKDHVVKYELTIRETVKAVDPEGNVTLVDEFEKSRNCVEDMDIVDITAAMPNITISRDSKGGFRINATGGDQKFATATVQLITQSIRMQNNVVPPKPVKVGDSWNFKGTDGAGETTGTTSVESRETIGGASALKLKCVTDSSGDGATVAKRHAEAISLIDAQTGKTLKITSHATSTSGTGKVTEDISFTPMDKTENADPSVK